MSLRTSSLILAGSAFTAMYPIAARADAPAPAAATSPGDDIIVTGTHNPTQTARKSVSPITVVNAAALQSTGQADLGSQLAQISPSITQARITSGAGNFVQKINLRTLTSNQTLILVNGKRRHVTSSTADTPGPENGTTPVDLAMIPAAAIDHIEILQDGAAALYGSDAIAGVVNIILKKNYSGGEFSANNGLFYKGDGFSSDENASVAYRLGKNGYIDLSGEYRHQGHTNRGENDSRVNEPVNLYFGLPMTNREVFALNAGYDLSSDVHLYAFGTYGHRTGSSYQNYRLASEAPALIPNGATPNLMDLENDYSFTAGINGDSRGWMWDFSATYGGDGNSYHIGDTINQSLYKATGSSPLDFYVGYYGDSQLTVDGSVRRALDVGFAAPIEVTVGGQYRNDGYKVKPGEADSYYGAGTDGFSGLPLSSAVNAHRNVGAAYIDVSTRPIEQWQIDASGRYEDYTNSGHVFTGKLSSRFDFNRFIGIRGTIANGFRAPTMAEQYYSKIGVTSTGASGTLASDSAGAKLLGAPALKPERSTNYSASLLLTPTSRWHITADAYQITIRDRIVDAGTASGASAIAALQAQGVGVNTGATAVTVTYFTNAADTRTRGLDIKSDYHLPLGQDADIDFDLAFNMNQTDVLKINDNTLGKPLLNAQSAAYISTYFPKNKIIAGAVLHDGRFTFDLHEIRWGPFWTQRGYYYGTYANSITVFDPFYNRPEWQTNIAVTFDVSDRQKVTLGADNLFNRYPNVAPASTVYAGVANYEQVGQGLDVEGGYYYLNYRLKF